MHISRTNKKDQKRYFGSHYVCAPYHIQQIMLKIVKCIYFVLLIL